jgi:flagellar hook-associated protein FlgK
MSKLAALKGKTGPSTVTKISESLTAGTLSEALEGGNDAPRKARKKTNRTVPFSTRVSQQFDDEFRRIAFEGKLKHAELMEHMLELYKKHKL